MDPKKFFAELTRRNVCKIARKVLGNHRMATESVSSFAPMKC
jgi:hypothetical protein